jgi:hypothetical protein
MVNNLTMPGFAFGGEPRRQPREKLCRHRTHRPPSDKAEEHASVRLNKSAKTAIDRDDREIVHFRLGFSSKKGIDIETIFLAK